MGSDCCKTKLRVRVMHKFFVDNSNISEKSIYIIGEDVSHINKVLRLRSGEKIAVSNGNGREFICSISEVSKKEVICEILEEFENITEAPIEITLFQGLPKSQKMDLIVQKCVEIGIYKIQPVITGRVVVKVEGKDISSKIERWRRIAEEAAKQSNRGIVPEVLEPISFDEALNQLKAMDLAIVPYEKERAQGFKEILLQKSEAKKIGVLIGPEGGFEESEIEECLGNGIQPITLGPRILRTETAGFVTATIILYEIGDMGGVK
jgi:16S rRNA (uracil1498-N3)-methyltransferase